MKCTTYRNYILLRHSGELGSLRRSLLARHLSRCAACRAYAEDAALVMTSARQQVADVSPAAIEAVLSFARKAHSRSEEIRFRPSREPLLRQWRPALVYAGFSVLLLIAFVTVLSPVLQTRRDVAKHASGIGTENLAWDDGMDEELSELSGLMATVSADWGNGESSAAGSEIEDIERLARELLELEGVQI